MGILERTTATRKSQIRLKHVANSKRPTVQAEIRQNVEAGSQVFTDTLRSYNGLSKDYIHEAIDHAREYVRGIVHTNGAENFWSLLKRGIRGTYISVEPFHLFRYLDEQAFRFNEREGTDSERFLKGILGVIGKRLQYSKLTGKDIAGGLPTAAFEAGVSHDLRRLSFARDFLYSVSRRSISDFGTDMTFCAKFLNFSNGDSAFIF